ncbi:MAG: phosphatidate cytidylyltransferase [Candidatus Heimdallarchaeota archaeon]|nr:MAG: phosphatidate cytidylyltransferase [Candidatus Heimdallarchaeota archaeon]
MEIFPPELALIQDILVLALTIILIILFIGFNFWLRKKGITSQYVTRKLIHFSAGPTLLLSFIFYSGQWFSPYIASLAPGLFVLLFLLIGFGIVKSEHFVKSMSRSEDPRELLRGTFYYVITGVFVTIFCWTSYPITENVSSPVSIVVVSTMAIGDGLADIVGRKVNRMKFKFLAEKSVPGSLAMFISSVISCIFFLVLFGYDLSSIMLLGILAIIAGTGIEALSPSEIDNLSVPLIVILVFAILTPLLAPSASWAVFYIHSP